jgi:hypothetical protein
MQATVRPFATAGVALIGAGVIAVTPIAPPLPDIHIPTLRADVALTQFVDPITNLVDFATTTSENLSALGAMIAPNPTPILSQIIANQTANAAAISTGLQTAATDLATNLAGLPAQLQNVLTQLASGDISGAVTNLFFEIPFSVALLPLLDAVSPLTSIAQQTTQNLANATAALGNSVLVLGLGALEPIFATVSAAGNIGQALFNAVTAGDLVTAASVLINAPIDLTNALLNGTVQGSPVGDGVGILTAGTGFAGPIAGIYNTLVSIAQSLTGMPPASASALAAANVAPAAASNTVTVTTAPAATAPATAASADAVTANTATTANTGAAAASSAAGANASPVAKVTTGKATATTGTTGATGPTGGNKAAPGNGVKKAGGAGGSTVAKNAAGLKRGAKHGE